jgi:hypothetical protein
MLTYKKKYFFFYDMDRRKRIKIYKIIKIVAKFYAVVLTSKHKYLVSIILL